MPGVHKHIIGDALVIKPGQLSAIGNYGINIENFNNVVSIGQQNTNVNLNIYGLLNVVNDTIRFSNIQIDAIENGGYLIKDNPDAQMTLIASGSELQMMLDASETLEECGVIANVVSMPCLDIFLNTSQEYQSTIIKDDLPILVAELSHPNSWFKLLNKKDKVLGIETFGESAPANVLLDHFGFNVPNVVEMAKSLMNE